MTILEVYNECFLGISPHELTIQQIESKRKEYAKKYHPDSNVKKTPQEREYAEKMFKEYREIINEIEKLKINGTLEYELDNERNNSRQDNEQFNGSSQSYNQYQSYSQEQGKTNEHKNEYSSFFRNDRSMVTIKPVGSLNNLRKYEIIIANLFEKTAKTNFIYLDGSLPLDNLGILDYNTRTYILNEILRDDILEECIKSKGGYVGGYDNQTGTWKYDQKTGVELNNREINKKMKEAGYCFQRSDGTWIGLHEIGEMEFSDANIYGSVSKIKQYKYYDYSTGMSGIIKGDIDIEYLKQYNLGMPIDLSYYSACIDTQLSSEQLQEKEQTLEGYVGLVRQNENTYATYAHSQQILEYFQARASEKANCRQQYYSNDDIKKAQENETEIERRNVFQRMRDACQAFKEAFRE